MLVLSCSQEHYFSSQVDVQMCGATRTREVENARGEREYKTTCIQSPVVHLQGHENIICRRGKPEPFTTPWDAILRAQGRGDQTAGDTGTENEPRKDVILTPVEDYWFKVAPVIRNRTDQYLVIKNVDFKVKPSGSNSTVTDKPFPSGYCETEPYLYIFSPGSTSRDNPCAKTDRDRERGMPECLEGSSTSYSDIDRSYVMGNLSFYLGGLPSPSASAQNNNRFPTTRIPNYSVEWRMEGTFFTGNGEQVGNFKKRGSFRTQKSSF